MHDRLLACFEHKSRYFAMIYSGISLKMATKPKILSSGRIRIHLYYSEELYTPVEKTRHIFPYI